MRLISMGVALSACTVPHAGKPSFELEENEIEIGIGIHGEPGRHRIPMENADGITDRDAAVRAILASPLVRAPNYVTRRPARSRCILFP